MSVTLVNRLIFFVRLSCVYIRSCNLRFLRIYVSHKTGTMASISEGISSYIILFVVIELYNFGRYSLS